MYVYILHSINMYWWFLLINQCRIFVFHSVNTFCWNNLPSAILCRRFLDNASSFLSENVIRLKSTNVIHNTCFENIRTRYQRKLGEIKVKGKRAPHGTMLQQMYSLQTLHVWDFPFPNLYNGHFIYRVRCHNEVTMVTIVASQSKLHSQLCFGIQEIAWSFSQTTGEGMSGSVIHTTDRTCHNKLQIRPNTRVLAPCNANSVRHTVHFSENKAERDVCFVPVKIFPIVSATPFWGTNVILTKYFTVILYI